MRGAYPNAIGNQTKAVKVISGLCRCMDIKPTHRQSTSSTYQAIRAYGRLNTSKHPQVLNSALLNKVQVRVEVIQ